MAEGNIEDIFMQALEHHRAGRLGEAEAVFREILNRQPEHAAALNGLGVIHFMTGRRESGLWLVRSAITLDGNHGEFHYNLGRMLEAMGRQDEAVAAAQRAVKLRPEYPEALNFLGNLLHAQGKLDETIAVFRRTTELRPDSPNVFYNLGNALKDKSDWDGAIAAYQTAIKLDPHFSNAHFNLGLAYQSLHRPDDAVTAYRRALQITPDDPEALTNLGSALKDRGQMAESIACYEQAMKVQPGNVTLASNRLFTLNYHPHLESAKIIAEHRKWNEIFAEPLKKEILPHANNRDPDRRLRIGYVSPDYRDHCQAFFTVPLFTQHDRENFEIFLYSNVVKPDSITPRIQSCADVWKTTTALSDAELAQMIRADQIDILVDLTMHMSSGRPLMFARKPAPIQVAWLAYPGTTGLNTVDYRLTDPYLDPQGLNDAYYTEQSIRLPNTFWCYDPQVDEPRINALPALSNGYVTFGCLNNFIKVHDELLTMWSRVMKAVPNSRMLLLAPNGSARQHVIKMLDVESSRVEFIPWQPRPHYLETYLRADLSLDTYPVNGHTTSLDSLWMGVPVVSLYGQTAMSRAGLSQSTNLGLTEQLVGRNEDEFVRLAVGLANDLPRLSELRSTLRQRMQNSPLMDARQFARDMESAYRRMWKKWIQS